MASVTFEQVTKQFGSYTAVNHLNLQVEDGEFLVLVGPSGCGKTTSLRLLAGLETVTEGNLYIGQQRINDRPPQQRDIAMVFQSYALYPHLSVYENMAFGLQVRRMARAEIEIRVKTAAAQMGIEHLLQRKPRDLSGGQRQRVAVGRALVRNPAVFLMDEPLSNLDAQLRVQARTEIIKLHQTLGATFIYVTHDQVEAMTMGSRIAVMDQGVLQQIDTPANLYAHPQNLFVAEFIGSPAMNLFKTTLIQRDRDYFVKGDGFCLKLPQSRLESYACYVGQPVVFGIRPESIHDPNYVPADILPEPVEATVSILEMMGNETFLYLIFKDGQNAVARVDRRSHLTAGSSVSVVFDMASGYLFDPKSEQLIVSWI